MKNVLKKPLKLPKNADHHIAKRVNLNVDPNVDLKLLEVNVEN